MEDSELRLRAGLSPKSRTSQLHALGKDGVDPPTPRKTKSKRTDNPTSWGQSGATRTSYTAGRNVKGTNVMGREDGSGHGYVQTANLRGPRRTEGGQ